MSTILKEKDLNYSTQQLIRDFNISEFRRSSIPMEMTAGWPNIKMVGKTICVTIPYYRYKKAKNKIALFPIYCSVTVAAFNPARIVDFTIYPNQREWADLDYQKPVGFFKHAALDKIKTKEEYSALCQDFYKYFDQMVLSVREGKPFTGEDKLKELFSMLMEPGQYPQYLKLNKKFYSIFCNL